MTASVSLGALGIQPFATVEPFAEPLCFSQPDELDLCVYRGDTGRFRIEVTEADLVTPIDITAATWDADIRRSADSELVGSFDVVPVEGTVNAVDVILNAELSELLNEPPYVYDVEMTIGTEVITLLYGDLTVTKDVSRDDVSDRPSGSLTGLFVWHPQPEFAYATLEKPSNQAWPALEDYPPTNTITTLIVDGVDVGLHRLGGTGLNQGDGWWSSDVSQFFSVRHTTVNGEPNDDYYESLDGQTITITWVEE